MSVERVKVDRGWIGAPEAAAWANPTVRLFVAAAWGLLALGSLGYLTGVLPALVAVPVNALAIYGCFTVMHEGVHRVAHRDPRWNDALARLSALPLTFTFPMFRAVHNEHHAHTNDLARDPDFIVARTTWTTIPWYRYRAVFTQIGGELAANGCRIGWTVAPLPRGVAPLPVEPRVR